MWNSDRSRAMRRPPLARLLSAALAVGLGLGLAAGCGNEIGDDCVINADCSPNGDRQCVIDMATQRGYCTIQGCAFNSCPEEAVCVRFFTGTFANRPCDHLAEDDGDPVNDRCSLDELCSVSDSCAPRSSEVRFCMKKCESDDDCRDGFECRDLARMQAHGGEPVLDQGERVTSTAPKFCAARGS